MAHGVLDEVGDGPLEEAGVGEHQRQGLVGLVEDGLVRDSAKGPLEDLVQRHRLEDRAHGTGLDATQVEQVRQQGVQPIGGLGGVVEQDAPVRVRQVEGRVLQRRDRGLDARQRGAQVVRHGRDQGGADRVRLPQSGGVRGTRGQPVALEDRGRLGREGVEHAPVRGRQGRTGQGHDQPRPGVDGDVGVVDGPRRELARDLDDGHAPPVGSGLEQRGAAHAERLAGLVEQGLDAVAASEDSDREGREDVRLGATTSGLLRERRAAVDDGRHDRADDDEREDGERVLGLARW